MIQDYLKSGRSLRVYSEVHRIKYDHLAYYVSAFKRKQAKHSGFIAVKPVTHQPTKNIQLVYQGLTFTLPGDIEADGLRRLVRVLLS